MGHHRISASGSSRWLKCFGSVELIEHLKASKMIPQRTYNQASQLGTAVHFVVEQVLLKKRKLKDFLGDMILEEGMKDEVLITKHELACARVCIKYVREEFKRTKAKAKGKKVKMFPERKYDLTKVYNAPMGGTADITIIEFGGTLHIIDYKNGRMSVDVNDNSQLRIYALGAFYRFHKKYKFKKVKVTVVQPNDNHVDGAIRSQTVSVKELLKWEQKVLVPALKKVVSKKGKLVPGETQCFWCEAKPHCDAYLKNKPKMLSKVMANIIPTTSIDTLPEMHQLSQEQLQHIVDDGDRVIKFYQDAKAHALGLMAEDRGAIDGWTVTPKWGNRKLVSMAVITPLLEKKGIGPKEVTIKKESRIMTVTELEAYVNALAGWNKDDVKKFMDQATTRTQTGYAMYRCDTAADEFAEFIEK